MGLVPNLFRFIVAIRNRIIGITMAWRVHDLAWFTALAVTLTMRESPVVYVIDGQQQRNTENDEAKTKGRRQESAA